MNILQDNNSKLFVNKGKANTHPTEMWTVRK